MGLYEGPQEVLVGPDHSCVTASRRVGCPLPRVGYSTIHLYIVLIRVVMKQVAKVLSVNVAILAVGLCCLELIWHVFYADDIRFTVNVLADSAYHYDVSPLYETTDPLIAYTRDRNGFRGRYAQVEDIDVLVVGGSTTDQRYIDDKEEWCRVLEEKLHADGLDLTIVNAGVDGQSTFGHIKNFELWFAKLATLHPKYILFYVGLNDFYKGENYSFDDLAQNSIWKSSFSYYVFRLIKGLLYANTYRMGHHAYDIHSQTITTTPLLAEKEYQPLMQKRLDAYLNRLRILREKTQELGATPIFVTQTRRMHWQENNQIRGIDVRYGYEGATYNGVDMHYMEKILNDTTLSMCSSQSGSICIDLASELEFSHQDFYDFAHNTPSGAAKIGHYLAGKIQSLY